MLQQTFSFRIILIQVLSFKAIGKKLSIFGIVALFSLLVPSSSFALPQEASSSTSTFLQSCETPLMAQRHHTIYLLEGESHTLQRTIAYTGSSSEDITHEWSSSQDQGATWQKISHEHSGECTDEQFVIKNAQQGTYWYRLIAKKTHLYSATETFEVIVSKPVIANLPLTLDKKTTVTMAALVVSLLTSAWLLRKIASYKRRDAR